MCGRREKRYDEMEKEWFERAEQTVVRTGWESEECDTRDCETLH